MHTTNDPRQQIKLPADIAHEQTETRITTVTSAIFPSLGNFKRSFTRKTRAEMRAIVDATKENEVLGNWFCSNMVFEPHFFEQESPKLLGQQSGW